MKVEVVHVTHLNRQDRNFNSFKELHKLILDLLETVQAEGQMKSKLKSIYHQVSQKPNVLFTTLQQDLGPL